MRGIHRVMRWYYAAEDKIRIVLEGLRGEHSIAELCRYEAIVERSNMAIGGITPTQKLKQAA